MLKNIHRYRSNFDRFPKIRIRYVALPIVAIAMFFILANFFDSPTIESKNTPSLKIAQELEQISPVAGNPAINLKDTLEAIQKTSLNLSKTVDAIIKPQIMALSEQELALATAKIPKPAKKPFLHLEPNLITTKLSENTTKKELKVSSGDTLGKLLERGGIGATEAYNISTVLKSVYNPKDMQIGQKLTIFTKNDDFKGLDIKKSLLNTLSLREIEDGRYTITEKIAPTHVVSFVKKGTIGSSLYKAALNEKIPDSLIVEMIHIYSWAIDFQRDIQSGDTFEMMYNMTMTEDNKVVSGKSEILYVKLDSRNADEIALYRYKDTIGDIGYYETTGRSVRKALMRTPINGARLSSGFGMRKHPVLGYSKMHKGVDFAAPRGTPIYAAGDGRIVYIGNKGGYGKYIKIRHYSGLETAYAHMKGFKKGLKRGSRVKQGKTIGYVGTTGRSTGPHLHYEVLSGGKQVNPRKIKVQKGKKLAGKDFEIFQGVVEQTKYQFSELLQNVPKYNLQAKAF